MKISRIRFGWLLLLLLTPLLLVGRRKPAEPPPRVAVILSGDGRLDKLKGLQAGLVELGYVLVEKLQPVDADVIFQLSSAPIRNALPDMFGPAALRAGNTR